MQEIIFKDPLGSELVFTPETAPHYHVKYPDGILEEIAFQEGSIQFSGVNGMSNELMIAAVAHRLKSYNKEHMRQSNEMALGYLEAALKLMTITTTIASEADDTPVHRASIYNAIRNIVMNVNMESSNKLDVFRARRK